MIDDTKDAPFVDDDVPAESNPERWAATADAIEFFSKPGRTESQLTPTEKLQNEAHDRIMKAARERAAELEDDEPGDDIPEDEDAT